MRDEVIRRKKEGFFPGVYVDLPLPLLLLFLFHRMHVMCWIDIFSSLVRKYVYTTRREEKKKRSKNRKWNENGVKFSEYFLFKKIWRSEWVMFMVVLKVQKLGLCGVLKMNNLNTFLLIFWVFYIYGGWSGGGGGRCLYTHKRL